MEAQELAFAQVVFDDFHAFAFVSSSGFYGWAFAPGDDFPLCGLRQTRRKAVVEEQMTPLERRIRSSVEAARY